ncbi:MAG TPA: hypothetical protein VIU11_23180 [Nakamurella sp.]
MDRRPVGVALVVLALAAGMVLPALSGLRSTGTAVPIALPTPPAVGECVAQLSRPSGETDRTPPQLAASAVLFGICRGSIAGEVVAFWPTQETLANAPRSRRAGPCYPPLADFTGLNVKDAATDPASTSWIEPVSWRSALSYQAYLIIPSDLELRAGREWSACVIAPAAEREYVGSLRDSYREGSLPTVFGSCWESDGSGLLAGPVDCTEPHAAQLMATAWNGTRVFASGADVLASCTRMAGRVMDVDDPTRGDQLAVIADRMAALIPSWDGNPSSIGCFVSVAGERRMTGLVIGLGDRPVRFVS